MNQQVDLFGAGEANSLPPHLDPEIVGSVDIDRERDRDHVGAADIGKYGNDSTVYVVRVFDKAGVTIFAESVPNAMAATRLRDEITGKLAAGRQQSLSLFG